eukprot:TRINITY_DN7487_c0_g1_i1.p1 TRINITY_DN7487_c0_g1~~TRINITY_DN7487_c0_g1_i1.p1  ORF type:complete len:133 (+),score=20.71 TRINITY_DN7487_c0_g1_i1:115-513(+)
MMAQVEVRTDGTYSVLLEDGSRVTSSASGCVTVNFADAIVELDDNRTNVETIDKHKVSFSPSHTTLERADHLRLTTKADSKLVERPDGTRLTQAASRLQETSADGVAFAFDLHSGQATKSTQQGTTTFAEAC